MTMNLTGPRTVLVADLEVKSYVRTAINQDHVLYLAQLYEAGAKVPPIVVNKRMEIIDGRHRREALLLLGTVETPVLVAAAMDEFETMCEALKANTLGPMPPSPEDITYVITQMISAGASQKQIKEKLPFPASMTAKHIQFAVKRIKRKLIADAVDAVLRDGISVDEAAKRFHVTADDIKEVIIARKDSTETVRTIMGSLDTRFNGLSRRMTQTGKDVMAGVQSGDVSRGDAVKFTEKITGACQRLLATANTIKARLETAMKGGKAKIEVDEEES